MSRAEPAEHIEEIAVIGMACRAPGARNGAEFWQNLCDGVEALATFSEDELAQHQDATLWRHPSYVNAGFVLDDIDQFDADFFAFTPKQAQMTDPQQRLFLECVWEALESAGVNLARDDQLVGVYAGANLSTYLLHHQLNDLVSGTSIAGLQALIGNDKDYLATQTAYKLNLRGPAINVQTACSTGLVAVHLASQSLLNYECDVAIAGAATVRVPHRVGYLYEAGSIFSPDGHCRPFDARAQGTVKGSGVGVVVLKRLSAAVADRDPILAVIKGSAINNDGDQKVGYTAPSELGQTEVITEALAMADVDPATISYVETHGTGTPVGDPIEIAALTAAFAMPHSARQTCAIGSVKSNIGHLETAAGIVSLIKTVLALHHKMLPPSLHYTAPNPALDIGNTPFYVNTKLSNWQRNGGPRRAGVSSFGIGGTNVHMVLEEAPSIEPPTNDVERPRHLLCLSAKSEQALIGQSRQYRRFLATDSAQLDRNLADICYTANVGRKHFAHRLSVAADSAAQMQAQLASFANGEAAAGVSQGYAPQHRAAPKVAFLFTGQGGQYVDMGRELYETQLTFRQAMKRCDAIVREILGGSLLAELYPERSHSQLNGESTRSLSADRLNVQKLPDTLYTQPALFAVEYALAQLWQSWGVQPAIVMGHSFGEIVAACVAGLFSLEDGLKLVAARGRLIGSLPPNGEMVAVMASEEQIRPIVAPYNAEAAIAVVNGPRNVVISGTHAAMEAIVAALEAESIKARRLAISYASHSPLMEPILAQFGQVAREITYSPPQLTLVSNVTGDLATDEVMTSAYWMRHLRQPVRFADGVATLQAQGVHIFLELGPKSTLLGMAESIFDSQSAMNGPSSITPPHPAHHIMLPSLRPGAPDWQQILDSLGQMYVQGVDVDWSSFDSDYERRKAILPTYPFQRQRYWLDETKRHSRTTLRPLIDKMTRLPLHNETVYEAELSLEAAPFLADHRVYGSIVAPAACHLAMVLNAAALTFEAQHCRVEDVVFPQALMIPEAGARTAQLVLSFAEANGAGPSADFQLISFDEQQAESETPLHAAGRLLAQAAATGRGDLAALQARIVDEVSIEAFYAALSQKQVEFGPRFRWLAGLWRNRPGAALPNAEALARLYLPEVVGGNQGYALHPGLLAACLLVTDVAQTEERTELLIPFAVESLTLHSSASDAEWWCHAIQVDERQWDIRLFDATGQLVMEIAGLQARAASAQAFQTAAAWREWLYTVEWQARPQFGRPPDYLPTPAELQERSRNQALAPTVVSELEQYMAALAQLESLSLEYVLDAFAKTGFIFRVGARWRTVQIAQQMGVIPPYHRLLERLLGMLAAEGVLEREGEVWRVLRQPERPHPRQRRQQLQEQLGAVLGAELTMLNRCASKLSEVLRGLQNPLDLLFPGGDASLAAQLYSGTPVIRVLNNLLQKAVGAAIEQAPPTRGVRILEIGAGTGGATASLLPHLPAAQTDYHFTDIGAAFTAQAQEKFAEYDFVHYQTLDIEQAPAGQGFAPHQYDIVIAANVLHATRDLHATLAHVQALLAPGGLLVLLESTAPSRWVDLTVGLTDGWWRFDDMRSGHPLLTADAWQELLLACGFQSATSLSPDAAIGQRLEHAVILAQSAAAVETSAGEWLILTEGGGLGRKLADALHKRGRRPLLAVAGRQYQQIDAHTFCIRPDQAEDYLRLLDALPSLQGVIHLAGLGEAVHLLQALLQRPAEPPALWLVTCGAQKVTTHDTVSGFAQAPLWGLSEIIEAEHPELRCVCVDLDTQASDEEQALALSAQIIDAAPQFESAERHVALRREARFVPRLTRFELQTTAPIVCHPDAAYLITGAWSQSVRTVAHCLAAQGARHLVYVAEDSQSQSKAHDALAAFAALDVEWSVVQADIADMKQIERVLHEIDEAYPLRGLVYSAGASEDGPLAQQPPARVADSLQRAARGVWRLHALTQDAPLDFFVLSSPTTSLLGRYGEGNRATVGAFLDAIAAYRQAQGLPALSIHWDSQSEAGDVEAAHDEQEQQTLAREMSGQALPTLFAQDGARIGVLPIDWRQYGRQFDRLPAFLEMLSAEASSAQAASAPTDALPAQASFRQRLETAPVGERRQLIVSHVQSQVAAVLGLSRPLAHHVGFMEMGLDSLMAIQFKRRLEASLELSLISTLALEHPTIDALSDYLHEKMFPTQPDAATQLAVENEDASASAESQEPLHESSIADLLTGADELVDSAVDALVEQELLKLEALLKE